MGGSGERTVGEGGTVLVVLEDGGGEKGDAGDRLRLVLRLGLSSGE